MQFEAGSRLECQHYRRIIIYFDDIIRSDPRSRCQIHVLPCEKWDICSKWGRWWGRVWIRKDGRWNTGRSIDRWNLCIDSCPWEETFSHCSFSGMGRITTSLYTIKLIRGNGVSNAKVNLHSISILTGCSQSLLRWPKIKQTIERDVSVPLCYRHRSLLCGWLAQVILTRIRRSKAELIENTPTSSPTGGKGS